MSLTDMKLFGVKYNRMTTAQMLMNSFKAELVSSICWTRLFFCGLLLGGVPAALGQQDPMYNQYLFNAYTINAAEAGARNYGTASMLYRWQWQGIEGAPTTGSVGFETNISKGWGIGFNVVDDRIGPTSNQTVNMATAYHISLTDKVRMSVGLNAVGNIQRVDLQGIQQGVDLNDPLLRDNIRTFNPNIGGGILLYGPNTFIGLSAPRFMEYRLTKQDLVSLDQLRHIFLYGGHSFRLSERLKLKPSFLGRVVNGAPPVFDFNGVISFYDVLDLGVNYRSGDGMGVLIGFTFAEKLILNYAYELPVTDIRTVTMRTHEVGVRYRFGRSNFDKISSPRFFN